MKSIFLSLAILLLGFTSFACETCEQYDNDNFVIKKTKVKHDAKLGVTIWEITVAGIAGATTPKPAGQLHNAPVLGYVFPTNLQATDVGFSSTEGIVALALTSHPDFDDTPLWDENNDRTFDNDGIVWHPHWVVLEEDKRVAGGYSVKQFDPADKTVTLPPTNPGMPMYMDSPGFQVLTQGNKIRLVIPDYRINHRADFSFDALTCYMQVNTENKDQPMLGVYQVYSIASGNLSLPYTVR